MAKHLTSRHPDADRATWLACMRSSMVRPGGTAPQRPTAAPWWRTGCDCDGIVIGQEEWQHEKKENETWCRSSSRSLKATSLMQPVSDWRTPASRWTASAMSAPATPPTIRWPWSACAAFDARARRATPIDASSTNTSALSTPNRFVSVWSRRRRVVGARSLFARADDDDVVEDVVGVAGGRDDGHRRRRGAAHLEARLQLALAQRHREDVGLLVDLGLSVPRASSFIS